MNKVLLSIIFVLVLAVIYLAFFDRNIAATTNNDQSRIAAAAAKSAGKTQKNTHNATSLHQHAATGSSSEIADSPSTPAELLAQKEAEFIHAKIRNDTESAFISSNKVTELHYHQLVKLMDDIEAVSTNQAIEYTMQYSDFFLDKTKQNQAGVSVDRLSCGEKLCIALLNYHEKDSIGIFFDSLREEPQRLKSRASLLLASEKYGYTEQQKFAVLFSTAGSKVVGFSVGKG